MSFADELRKPYINDDSDKYRAADLRTRQCVGAIKDSCIKARQNGETHIVGYFAGYDDDYGSYFISEEGGMFFPMDIGFPFDYWKESVENEIRNLGFTKFSVQIIQKPKMEQAMKQTFLGVKNVMVKTGRMEAGMRVEIYW